MSGWIKLHRQITDWEWYSDTKTFRLFIHLLLKANHKDNKYRGKLIKKGSFVTGREILSIETGMSVREIRTCLDRLKSTNEIAIKTNTKGTEIQIVNYEKYQEATSETTSDYAIKRPTNDQQTTTNKNDKKEKNDKEQSIGSEKELILKFTSWFNEMYLKHQSKNTKYRTMTKTDINNLKKLKEVYDAKDFDKAFRNMLVNPWVVENNKGTIDHFLRNDNFVKYLNTETIEETKTKFKAAWQ